MSKTNASPVETTQIKEEIKQLEEIAGRADLNDSVNLKAKCAEIDSRIELIEKKICMIGEEHVIDHYLHLGFELCLLGFIAMTILGSFDFSNHGLTPAMFFTGFMMIGCWIVGGMSLAASVRLDRQRSKKRIAHRI
jgi:hypothetical protein